MSVRSPIVVLTCVILALVAAQSHARARILRIDNPGAQCDVLYWNVAANDPNLVIDGNADSSQDVASFFNPGTIVTPPAIYCIPSESLSLIWNMVSVNNPPSLEATQDPPNPASMPDPNTGLPTIAALTATDAVIYEWINPNVGDVNGEPNVPDAEVIVWNLPISSTLPNGGVEIEFDNWCATNDYATGNGTPAPPTAIPSFTWSGITYTYTATCANWNGYDLILNAPGNSGEIFGYVDLNNNTVLTSTPPGWQATALPVPVLSATSGAGGHITLTWTATPGATSYNLYGSQTPGTESASQPGIFGLTGTTFTTGAYPPGTTTPYFKIAAVYNGAVSGLSNEVVSTALPATPTGLTATLSGLHSITLNWTASAGASTYAIYEISSSGVVTVTNIASGVTATSYTVNGLTPGQTYSFEVKAVDSGGDSAASNETMTTLLPPTVASSVALGGLVDYRGSGRSDFSVWRPSTGYFYSLNQQESSSATPWGVSTDVPVVGDFDGDGKTDVAVWRPSTGYWYIIQSSNGAILSKQWGASTDVPVVGDFDGDGKTDIAVWRPSTGYWYIVQSSNGAILSKQWGASTDAPVAGDFDGDGKTDIAVWRPSTGYWYIVQSSNGAILSKQWGASTDVPVVGDFDGDGKTDIAVWRPSTGHWYIVQSSNGQVLATQWGENGDVPVPSDYNGSGKTNIAVWRPANGTWFIYQGGSQQPLVQQWGVATDIPLEQATEH